MPYRALCLVPVLWALLSLATALAQPAQPDSNDDWIAVKGRIHSLDSAGFVLSLGEDRLRVQMRDWDWYPRGNPFLIGDQVTVYGRMDQSLLERHTIDATRVFVEDMSTYFDADGPAENNVGDPLFLSIATPGEAGKISITGVVEHVDGRTLQIESAGTAISVDISQLVDAAEDGREYRQLNIGDRVSVTGALGPSLFADEKTFQAESLIVEHRAATGHDDSVAGR